MSLLSAIAALFKPARAAASPNVAPAAPVPAKPAAAIDQVVAPSLVTATTQPASVVAGPDPVPFTTPAGFIAAVAPAAQVSAASTRIPASFTVAEGALESGWGAHAPGMNLFGIKADPSWHGAITTERTREVINGQSVVVTANFRAYSDWLGSIQDHAAFLMNNPRYKPAFACVDGASFARAVAAAGYATDPDYAAKIISIINAHGLVSLDKKELA
jgi:flagellar protein FlgJ